MIRLYVLVPADEPNKLSRNVKEDLLKLEELITKYSKDQKEIGEIFV